ncbi:hypothetical protein O3M35_002230 [Rhynocoris fuscipes]|uniref:Uncharacterized protein n=1 Tax=Rhynocoris fuscipes TaxID=488301 RepID=A0AAW1CS47_9HEMI
MWPLILRLGFIALAGLGLGFVLLSQHETLYREIPYERNRREPNSTAYSRRRKSRNGQKDEECQRQDLEDQLNSGTGECVICTENLHYRDKVWSCANCWNIFHLRCISQWAHVDGLKSSLWNCPICRKSVGIHPSSLTYKCMCGRVTAPKPLAGVTPHCCGQPCLRECGNKCHPGPCSRKHY